MPIMITGGTGFLGSYLARHLIQEKGETDLVLSDMHPTVSLGPAGYRGPGRPSSYHPRPGTALLGIGRWRRRWAELELGLR